jgi:hypothetical protein
MGAFESISAFRLLDNERGSFIKSLSLPEFEKFEFAAGSRLNVSFRKRKKIKAEIKAVTAV